MTVARLPVRDQQLERLWQRYLEARLRAEESTAIQDGIAAGKAWAEWLEAFSHDGSTNKVIQFRRLS